MQPPFDALIVGAGPAGATAATLLACAGWTVAIVEKNTFPRRKVCGECVAPSNFPLLDALGVGEEVAAAGGPGLRRVALMQGRRTVYAALPPYANSQHPWGRAVAREKLDTVLLRRAERAGAVVLQPWAADGVEGIPGAYRCRVRAVRTGECAVLHARVAIDAHGSWEALPAERAAHRRERRGARRPGELLAFKANFRHTALPTELLPVLSFPGGYGGMVVAGDGIATLACCIRADRLAELRDRAPGSSAGEIVGAMLARECAGVEAALRGASREGPWLASGPLHPGIHLESRDGIFRIGNAAGEAHPIIGEGMSMAMQSAWMLCAHLLGDRPRQAALGDPAWHSSIAARYQREWRASFAPRLRFAAAFAHLAMRPALSRIFLPLVEHPAALLRRGAIWSGKIRCVPDPGAIARMAVGGAGSRMTRATLVP